MRPFAVLLLTLALALTGCNSFQVNQKGVFADEGGSIVVVEYGQLKKEHETEFLSPANGKVMTMESKLAVRVDLTHRGHPEYSDRFMAYRCMNMLPSGTLYKSDNGKWVFHANGTTCSVFLWDEAASDYAEVFCGLITQGHERAGGAL